MDVIPVRTGRYLAMVVACIGLNAAAVTQGADAPPLAEQVRESVTRSLPYLEREGLNWINQKKCVTCHRVSFLTWSFSAAAKQGFDVDGQKLQEWNDWSLHKSLENVKGSEEVDGSRNLDGLAQMILGSLAYQDADVRSKLLEPLLPILLKGQRSDGSWGAGGQLPSQKRPKSETDEVTTMWIALALGTVGDHAEASEARDKAIQWLTTSKPGKSIEWYAVDLLLRNQQKGKEPIAEATRKLRSLQNADGGWSWLIDDKSDALATGLSLYALLTAEVSADDEAIHHATNYLLTTQQEDGSWKVPGTKMAKRDRVEETATYWGTAWAVIGLLKTLE